MNITLVQVSNKRSYTDNTLEMRGKGLDETNTSSRHKAEIIVALIQKHAYKFSIKWVDGFMVIADVPEKLIEIINRLFEIEQMTDDVKRNILEEINSLENVDNAIDVGMIALEMKKPDFINRGSIH